MPFSLAWIKMTSLGSFRFKWSLAPFGLFINCIRAPLTLLARALVIGPPKLLTTSFMFWFSMSSSKMHILLGCFMNHCCTLNFAPTFYLHHLYLVFLFY